jgi:glycosyltransferase involved in cell wall biosynthesis
LQEKKGVSVEILTSRDAPFWRSAFAEYEEMGSIKISRFRNFAGMIPKNCDIIHLHNFNVLPHFWISLTILVKRVLGLGKKRQKSVVTLHGGFTPWYEEFPPIKRVLKKIYHRFWGKFFLNMVVDAIIAVSESEREQLTRCGIKECKIALVPNGVEDAAYQLAYQNSRELEKYRPYLLFLGRIVRRKNLDFTIHCLSHVDGVNLLIAGQIQDKNYYQSLKNLSRRLGIARRVVFAGEVTIEKYKLIDNCLGFVLLSHDETDPIAVKEAIVRGKPVIVSNKAPLLHIVRNYQGGFVVSSEKEFAEAMNALLNKGNVGEGALTYDRQFGEKWKWDNIVGKTTKVYEYVLKS